MNLPPVHVVYYDDLSKSLTWLKIGSGEPEELSIEEYQKVLFQKFRMQAQGYQWMAKDELPWVDSKNDKQFALDDEISKNILMLSFKGNDQNKNCIFLPLSSELSYFIPSTSEAILRTDQKSIIASMAKRYADAFILEHEKQNEKIAQLKNYYAHAEKSIDYLQTQNKKLSEQYAQSIRDEIYRVLKGYPSIQFQLDPSVVQYFLKEQIPVHQISKIIQHSLEQLRALYPDKDVLNLSAHHILKPQTHQEATSPSHSLSRKNDKAHQILDKYENAAIALLSKNIKVNGKNIANYLKITPPAITDAFKKNEKSIIKALENNPNQWFQIRSYLRPVQKLSEEINRKAS